MRHIADRPGLTARQVPGPGSIFVPLRVRHEDRELAFFSTVATFGTPLDITVAELAIESFFPADEETRAFLRHRSTTNGHATV